MPASRVGYVPEAQGGLPPGPHVQYFTTAVVGFGQLVQSGVVERGGRGAFKGLVDVLAEFCISSLVIIYYHYPLGAAWRGVALRVHGVHRARLWSGLDAGRDRR